MAANVLARGAGGAPRIAAGTVLEWRDEFLEHPEPLAGAVVYDRRPTPLFRAAFVVEHGASALLMAAGGRNYHPLILAGEAGIPVIAGIGEQDLAGRQVTVDGAGGMVLAGEQIPAQSPPPPAPAVSSQAPVVYVNVGYPAGLREAGDCGAAGLGLLRTEFAAVKTLALHLERRLADGRRWRELLEQAGGNEADALYTIAQDPPTRNLLKAEFRAVVGEAVRRFGQREVVVRTLDIARRLDEPMGNRGIRRCAGSGGATIRLLCEAMREVLDEQGGQLGLILPLVSHYSQIQATMEHLLASGLSLRRAGSEGPGRIAFGWEIEQPAAAQNNALWLAAFKAQFGQPPDMIGIGTNDLTQFTLALGRDVAAEEPPGAMAEYLRGLYDEHEFSVVRQILEAAVECRRAGSRVFLLGQAGADPLLAPLLFAYGVTPSVAAARVAEVQRLAEAALQPGAARQAIDAYKHWVLERYPSAVRVPVEGELDRFFAAVPPVSIEQ